MPTALTYQEMLRTLGNVLDLAGAVSATISVSPQGAQLAAPSQDPPLAWEIDALLREAAAQRNWRLRPLPHSVPRGKRLGERLRVLGAALDGEGPGPYRISVAPTAIRAQGPAGFDRTFEPAQLRYSSI